MNFTPEKIAQIELEQKEISNALQHLYCDLVVKFAPSLKNEKAREYLCHGVCRRLKIIRRCIDNIFAIFPIGREHFLSQDERSDLEINLHAFVVNVHGLLDNIAWLFVFEKSIKELIESRRDVGLFTVRTQAYLPIELCSYLKSESINKWHKQYTKNYRDALLHRIPLYVPPSVMVPAEEKRYWELERRISDANQCGNFGATKVLVEEQKTIGSICAAFKHSFSDSDAAESICFHPQVIADTRTVMEILGKVTRCVH